VAARGARAAGGEATDFGNHRVGYTCDPEPLVRRLCPAAGELGWIDGRTVAIEYRWAEGRDERFAEIAAEFVQRKVDVIVTSSTVGVVATKQATSIIPIVFVAGDPVGTGLVASLARPGGNATGLSLQQTETNGKRFELLREVVPGLSRLAILANVGSPAVVLDMRGVQATARTYGLEVITLEIRRRGKTILARNLWSDLRGQ
jgi:putative tryptophan/tyrosine transport system substrate-binding protein